jgi:hypothetical protein
MIKRTLIVATALMIVCTLSAVAADVTGKWVGRVEMAPGRVMEQTIILKAEGTKLTGTVRTPTGDRQISEGKIKGDEISFATIMTSGARKMKMLYNGKISGNEIKFLHGSERGPQREFTVKRTAP